MSSTDNINATTDTSCCASCGIAEIDDVKLKECDDCDLVKYCSDECQENHKSEHEEVCKKRAAELRDELLFKQPESSHHGDCPICSIPLSVDVEKSTISSCCSKVFCNGCSYANQEREIEMRLEESCPFCREPVPNTKEEGYKQRMKRVEANDPVAIRREGTERYIKGEYIKAFEYWTMAAELGDVDAHFRLSIAYLDGRGVEKNEGKGTYHLEEAAIGGHPTARYILGRAELENRNAERAVKHWIIAATQGQDESMKILMTKFRDGFVSKEVLAATLRAHKTAVDATKSPQRELAEKFEQFKKEQIKKDAGK